MALRLLPRVRLPLLYGGIYLLIIAAAARVPSEISFSDAVVVEAGIGLFACIAIARDSGRTALSRRPVLYLSLQTVIATTLLGIEPDVDTLALLYVVLSLQAVLFLPQARGYFWLLGLSLLTVAVFFAFYDPEDAIPYIFTYCAAYMFTGVLATAVVEAAAARARSEGLLAELREKEAAQRELAVSEERNRLAREIHDTLAQGFTGIVLQLEAAEESIEDSPQEAAARLARAKSLARESLQEARHSVWNLLPQALEQHTVEEALRNEVRRFAAEGQQRTSFSVRGDRMHLAPEVQTALLRVCQESLTNVRKHAAASEVRVTLSYQVDSVRLQVLDNGVGIASSAGRLDGSDRGRGLAGMEERALILGGSFLAEETESGGTRVLVEIPLAGVEAR
jgi:signal transduction histidine kinase